ncbi:hypothetical protein, partial [Sphingobium sp. AP50]|uniref:hypothetical protein n=1 Tax=Sphingobium sp. AP50 TaxID=1884369 RepID=UPI001C433606
SLEQARRSAVAHHDNRTPQMGMWVVINAGWYKCGSGALTQEWNVGNGRADRPQLVPQIQQL